MLEQHCKILQDLQESLHLIKALMSAMEPKRDKGTESPFALDVDMMRKAFGYTFQDCIAPCRGLQDCLCS